MSEGVAVATNLLSNSVQLNLNSNEEQLQTLVTKLSSGLRINSAADDPSGNAIATNLTSQYESFDQASQNVQTASNAANVALGALTQQTEILQRIRTLAVEAASDVNSQSDRENLQAEVSQLLLEVNRIAQDTSFNGQALLDGSHAGNQAGAQAYFTITSNAVLIGKPSFLIASVVPANANFQAAAALNGSVVFNAALAPPTPTVDGTIEAQVVTINGSIGVQETFIASATHAASVSPVLYGPLASSSAFDNLKITFGAFSTADVGQTAYIKISQGVAAYDFATAPAFQFQSGAQEGDVIQIGIGATNTNTLRVSNINLALSSNATLGAEDAIGQVDIALQTLTQQQSQLGATVVRLGIDQQNDDTAATNLEAAESNIADLNVGQATTEFTKLQLLVQVGTSVLAQSNSNADTILSLFR
jgi:flagellin